MLRGPFAKEECSGLRGAKFGATGATQHECGIRVPIRAR